MPRKSKKEIPIYSCDFETTTNEEDCRVWAWGAMDVMNTEDCKIGNNIRSFMRWMSECGGGLIFFHNLKFDGSFIVNYLLHHDFKFEKDCKSDRTFSTVISNMGQWYAIDINYGDDNKVRIQDSLKKIPFSVAAIAKSFGFGEEDQKGDLDYKAYRSVNHILTEEERDYLLRDVRIVAKALREMLDEGLDKMTASSDALAQFKESIGHKTFEKLYPTCSLERNEEFRAAYKGGFTWLNPKYAGKEIKAGKVYDVVSLYPSRMYECKLPWGTEVPFQGKYTPIIGYPLYIQKIECEFTLKKDHIPTIQIKNMPLFFKGNDYLHSSDGERVTLSLTNVDLQLFFDHYEVHEPIYLGGYAFKQRNDVFRPYIDKYIVQKEENEGAKRAQAKLMLNSLYGKFATNPDKTGKIPELKADGALRFVNPTDEHGNIISEFSDPVYTPAGAFITAYARDYTIRTAQKVYDRIIYCDTDSIHIEGEEFPEVLRDIIGGDLGQWKHECDFTRGKFIRQKTYVEQEPWIPEHARDRREKPDGEKKNTFGKRYLMKKYKGKTMCLWCPKLNVKCAGMPQKVKNYVNFQNFEIGFSCFGKLTPKQVKGGVVLIDSPFTLK